jgi:hypothetical protein
MLSRALSLATVTLLIGCFAAGQAPAQNLEAGKSPAQIFAGACNACHRSPRGLLKSVSAGSLPGFLRQHYTTSGEMASLLAGFLISNGAADTRYVGAHPKPGKDAKPEARTEGPLRRAPSQQEPQQAAIPDADGLQTEPGRGRNAKRLARPGEPPEVAKPAIEGQAQRASERGPDGRKSAQQRLSKRGKPDAEDPSKLEAAKPDTAKPEAAKPEDAKPEDAKPEADKAETAKQEPAADETAKEDKPKSETANDTVKEESAKPSSEAKSESEKSETEKSESAKVEPPNNIGGEPPVSRADPVPPVTPAPPVSPAMSAAVPGGTPEPAAPASAPPAPEAPAQTASVPPPRPIAPAGPPAPPISE